MPSEVEWEHLLNIRRGLPVTNLPMSLGELMTVEPPPWIKVSVQQYLSTTFSFINKIHLFEGFAWVASDGASRRALFCDPGGDDGKCARPPDELLPKPSMTQYNAILAHAREDLYFRDSVFYCREVSFNRFTFFWRKVFPADSEYPIAISCSGDEEKWHDAVCRIGTAVPFRDERGQIAYIRPFPRVGDSDPIFGYLGEQCEVIVYDRAHSVGGQFVDRVEQIAADEAANGTTRFVIDLVELKSSLGSAGIKSLLHILGVFRELNTSVVVARLDTMATMVDTIPGLKDFLPTNVSLRGAMTALVAGKY